MHNIQEWSSLKQWLINPLKDQWLIYVQPGLTLKNSKVLPTQRT